MCKKCICLIRVSTVAQDLEGQREKVVANAIADGYSKDEIAVVQKKESAIKLNEMERESLNEMKEIIAENPTIESVYVFAIDRLARKVSIVLSVKDYLTERGINLVFLNPHKMSTLRKDEKTGKIVEDELTSMLLMFLSYGAEMEMKIKKERFAAAKAVMQKQNKITCGKPVYGYKKNADGTVSVNEEEAKVIRTIYYEILENNKSLRQIEREMIAKGIFQAKRLVTGSYVRSLAKNTAYFGSVSSTSNKIVYPPIVAKEEYDAVQKKLAENKVGTKKETKCVHLCKRLLHLNGEHRVMTYQTGANSYRDEITNVRINYQVANFIAWYVGKTLQTIKTAFRSDENKEKCEQFVNENNKKIENIKKLLEATKNRKRKAFAMYLDGKVNDTIYKEQIAQIDKEIQQWNNEIAKLESENKRMQLESEAKENKVYWNSEELDNVTDLQARKDIIDDVIKEIQINKIKDKEYSITVIPKDTEVQELYNELQQGFIYKVSGHKITLIDKTYNSLLDISKYVKTGTTPNASIIKKLV